MKIPSICTSFLDVLADTIIDYLNSQIEAGADSVMIFDTWGGLLNKESYENFSLRYMSKIVDGITREYERKNYSSDSCLQKEGQLLA